MSSILYHLSLILLLTGCSSSRHYRAFQYDNGDDYVSEGLYRIVDRKGRIGYADETGKTRPSSVPVLPSAIHSRVAGRKLPIQGNGKKWQVPVARTGIGKVMTGITSTFMVKLSNNT